MKYTIFWTSAWGLGSSILKAAKKADYRTQVFGRKFYINLERGKHVTT